MPFAAMIRMEKIGGGCWVAEIIGLDERYGFDRRFLKGLSDYSESNSRGTRGVYLTFLLREGCYYEVSSSTERYYCKAWEGSAVKVSFEEVIRWLSLASELMS